MPRFPPERIDVGDVVLRRVREADAALVAESVAANRDWLSSWMVWAVPLAGTVEEQRRRIPVAVAGWEQGRSFQYLAIHAETGAHLGNFGLERRIGPGALEIGYWLAENATGRGYATAAVRALTAVALGLDDVERVEIHNDRANTRSALIPQRLGYRLDRIEPDAVQTPAQSGQSMIWIYELS
jgi:RimJ/RimL family protein N-acetyltransferase